MTAKTQKTSLKPRSLSIPTVSKRGWGLPKRRYSNRNFRRRCLTLRLWAKAILQMPRHCVCSRKRTADWGGKQRRKRPKLRLRAGRNNTNEVSLAAKGHKHVAGSLLVSAKKSFPINLSFTLHALCWSIKKAMAQRRTSRGHGGSKREASPASLRDSRPVTILAENDELTSMVIKACLIARDAVFNVRDFLSTGSRMAF